MAEVEYLPGYSADEEVDATAIVAKPAVKGVDLPIVSLSAREFEVLVYRLKSADWADKNATVRLMLGGNDQGRDVVVYDAKKEVAEIVQCKRYNRPLTKTQVAHEFLKLALHLHLNPSLLGSSRFKYEIWCPEGLANDAGDLVATWPKEFTAESMAPLAAAVIKKYDAFAAVKWAEVGGDVVSAFVQRLPAAVAITGPDISARVRDQPQIYEAFFQVTLVMKAADAKEAVAQAVKENIAATKPKRAWNRGALVRGIGAVALLLAIAFASLLVWPLHVTASLPTAGGLVATFVLTVAWLVKQRRWLVVSASAVLLGTTTWAAVSPLILEPGPLYFWIDDGTSGGSGAWIPLDATKLEAGSLILLQDPIRPTVFELLRLHGLGSRLRGLNAVDGRGAAVVEIPVTAALEFQHRSAAGIAARTFFVPFIQRTIALEMHTAAPARLDGTGKWQLGVGPSCSTIVSFYEPAATDDRWRWIRASPTLEVMRYGALVDRAIDFAYQGRGFVAASELETALELAPTALERARVQGLLTRLFSIMLQGNFGRLQSLLLAHDLRKTLTGIDEHLLSTSRLGQWAVGEVGLTYVPYPVFRPVIDALARRAHYDTTRPKNVEREQLLKRIEEIRSQRPLSRDEVESFSRQYDAITAPQPGTLEYERLRVGALKAEELEAELRRAGDPGGVRLIAELSLAAMCGHHTPAAWSGAEATLSVLESADVPEPTRGVVPSRVAAIRVMREGSGLVDSQDASSFKRQLIMMLGTYGAEGFESTWRMMVPVLGSGKREIEPPPSTPRPNSDWWNLEYLDWAGYQLFKLVLAHVKSGEPGSGAHLDLERVEQIVGSSARLSQDGAGRPFLPGMALLVRFTEASRDDGFSARVRALDAVLEAPYLEVLEAIPPGLDLETTRSIEDEPEE